MKTLVDKIRKNFIEILTMANAGAKSELAKVTKQFKKTFTNYTTTEILNDGKETLQLSNNIIIRLIQLRADHKVAMMYFNTHYVNFLNSHLTMTTKLLKLVIACVNLETLMFNQLSGQETTTIWSNWSNSTINVEVYDTNATSDEKDNNATSDEKDNNATSDEKDNKIILQQDVFGKLGLGDKQSVHNANLVLQKLNLFLKDQPTTSVSDSDGNAYKYALSEHNNVYQILKTKLTDVRFDPCKKTFVIPPKTKSNGSGIFSLVGGVAFGIVLYPAIKVFSNSGGSQTITRRTQLPKHNVTTRTHVNGKLKKYSIKRNWPMSKRVTKNYKRVQIK
jgi:hypothetical protein